MLPATIPLRETVGYVAAAYAVVFVLLLVYLAIMAARVKRVERELHELEAADHGIAADDPPDERNGHAPAGTASMAEGMETTESSVV